MLPELIIKNLWSREELQKLVLNFINGPSDVNSKTPFTSLLCILPKAVET